MVTPQVSTNPRSTLRYEFGSLHHGYRAYEASWATSVIGSGKS